MGRTLTWQQVAAEFLRHPQPESDAARKLVRRMVQRGMPCVPGRAGGLFFGDQVEAWLRAEAERAAQAAEAERRSRPRRRRSRGRRRSVTPVTSPIRQRVNELRAGLDGER